MNKLYPFQLWITSVVIVAPILLLILGLINKEWNTGRETIPIFILFGLFCSLHALVICYFTFNFLIEKYNSPLLIKAIICLITCGVIFFTFLFIQGSMTFFLSLVYSGSVIISSLILKINKKKSTAYNHT
jgi:hypothetical protein